MAFTCRLKPELESEAKQFAEAVGISLMALTSLALRDYLDRRTKRFGKPYTNKPRTMVVDLSGKTPEQQAQALADYKSAKPPLPVIPNWCDPTQPVTYRAPHSRSDPCPCGSKNALGQRVKWKHCHGRVS